MPLPQPDPSLPSGPAPLFSDLIAVRGDNLRANNQKIWENLQYLFDFTGRNTDTLAEGPTNLYYTDARAKAAAIAAALTGYVAGSNTPLSSSDLILAAFGKVQGQLNARALTAGNVVQSVYTSSSAADTTQEQIPWDDTAPTNGEGKELSAINTTITPTSASNKLRVEVCVNLSDNSALGAERVIMGLFRDSVSNSVATVGLISDDNGSTSWQAVITYEVIAGSTSATTFKIRYGNASGGITYVNDVNGNATFGGTQISWMRISEIGA